MISFQRQMFFQRYTLNLTFLHFYIFTFLHAGGIAGTVEFFTVVETTATLRIGMGCNIEVIN